MHTSTLSRRAALGALALLLLLTLIPAGLIGAPVAMAQAPACPRTLAAAEWEGSFTFAYSGSATATDGDYSETAAVNSSASVTVRFITHDPYDPSDFQMRWHGVDAAGSISINNTGREGGMALLTRGDGPPLVTEGLPLGAITVDVETCTYDVDVVAELANVLNQAGDEPFYTDMSAFSFGVYDRPVNEAAGPGANLTLTGSASVPVAAAMDTYEVDSAGLDGGHVAHRLISIHSLRGDAHAGMASVSWTLRPVAPQPRITGVELLRQEYPSGAWVPVGAEGVVDSEPVLVKVFVENPTNGLFQLPLRFLDGEANELLPRGEQQLTLGPGTIEAGYMWDTTGWTWEDGAAGAALAQGGAPQAHPDRRIQVRLGADANLYDQAEKPVRVRARPVVLVHGLNSNDGTWSKYPGYLHEINFTWKAYPVHLQTGYSIASQQRSHLLVQNARTLADWVEYVRREEQTRQVDIVAHSMGGLISRQYIHSMMPVDEFGLPAVRHLVMLGTPNRGSSCANLILGINLLHDIPNLLAPLELTPESVARFNGRVFAQKGTLFSVLVGDDNKYKCELTNLEPSDDVVLASSARYTFVHAYTDSAHTEMTESHDDFARFVMPMLLDRPHSARTTPRSSVVLDATPAQVAPDLQLAQTLSRTVPAGGSVEIPLAMPPSGPQDEAKPLRAAVQLIAAEGVTATLMDPAGAIVATSAAGSPESRAWLRSLTVEQPAAGTWTLRLESQEAEAHDALVALQVAGGSLLAAAGAAPDGAGGAQLTLRLSDGGAPVTGASVTATLVGPDDAPVVLTLHDDGAHGDGAPGDGLYGAATGPLADGSYAAAVSARAGERALASVATFSVGETASAYTVSLPMIRR